MGRSILLQLSDIGKKYGYKLTIVKTDLRDYGIPQKRTRTLYFFYKDFLYFNKPNIDTPDLIDYLNQKPVTRGDDISC
jgi:site-specific DNA-cytosine methylase